MANTGASLIDEALYLRWFTWARDNLGRDLDSSHAAAEAGYRAQEDGSDEGAARDAARAAGVQPASIDTRSVALAEWAYWAKDRFGTDSATALDLAGKAIDSLESTHSLASATATVEALAAPQPRPAPAAPPPAPAAPTPSPAPGFWRANWPAVVGLMAVSAIVAIVATAGLMSAFSVTESPSKSQSEGPQQQATLSVVAMKDGSARAYLTAFPPEAVVYILLDAQTEVAVVHTDGAGAGSVTFAFPPGGHTVAACLDPAGGKCLATDFVSS